MAKREILVAKNWFVEGGRMYMPGDEYQGKRKFMMVAEEYAEQHGCSLADAITSVVKSKPQLHRDYLRTLNYKVAAPTTVPGPIRDPRDHKFMEAARERAEKEDCSISEAISFVVRTRPGLHEAFLESCKQAVKMVEHR